MGNNHGEAVDTVSCPACGSTRTEQIESSSNPLYGCLDYDTEFGDDGGRKIVM